MLAPRIGRRTSSCITDCKGLLSLFTFIPGLTAISIRLGFGSLWSSLFSFACRESGAAGAPKWAPAGSGLAPDHTDTGRLALHENKATWALSAFPEAAALRCPCAPLVLGLGAVRTGPREWSRAVWF